MADVKKVVNKPITKPIAKKTTPKKPTVKKDIMKFIEKITGIALIKSLLFNLFNKNKKTELAN